MQSAQKQFPEKGMGGQGTKWNVEESLLWCFYAVPEPILYVVTSEYWAYSLKIPFK